LSPGLERTCSFNLVLQPEETSINPSYISSRRVGGVSADGGDDPGRRRDGDGDPDRVLLHLAHRRRGVQRPDASSGSMFAPTG